MVAKLSVAMIVKNEAAILEKCLASVRSADEIVIVDTGSTDKTIEIAQRFTDKIFTDYVWADHFANARNHAISKCTGDWILSIDADDWLDEGGMEKFRKIIAENPQAYCFNITFAQYQSTSSHKIPYLYRNCKEVFWKGAAHNYLSIPAQIDSGAIIRYGYSPAHKNDPDRTLRILKREVNAHPEKPRELYYLSREYRYRKEWITSLYWILRYLKVAYWHPEKADAYLMTARCLWELQRGDEARDACLQAIKINTNFREALLFMAGMSGPINREKWLFLAELANNTQVLFVREKLEQPASYYEKMNDTEPRYDFLYQKVGELIGSKSMLDIGCGQGALKPHVRKYAGFDMVKNPYCVADIYTHDYGDYDVYVLLEVLEHLKKDIDILKKIPVGKEIVFSVPSFDCPPHVRVFTEDIVRWRYRDLIKLDEIIRFNFNPKTRKWRTDHPATPTYILLCRGWRV